MVAFIIPILDAEEHRLALSHATPLIDELLGEQHSSITIAFFVLTPDLTDGHNGDSLDHCRRWLSARESIDQVISSDASGNVRLYLIAGLIVSFRAQVQHQSPLGERES